MEFAGQPRLSGACNLLGVPGFNSIDVDEDEGEFLIGIRPKSSPLPRRKSSLSDEESEPGPPLCGSRRVSFADASGLSLVQVKEFDIWDVPKLPECDTSMGNDGDSEEYLLSPLTFSLPLSPEELFAKVRDQKLELETIDLLPGTTILKGVIRVLNISFDKAVYVRTTLDSWSSHFDLLAEYIPGSNEGLMDCFSFKLTLVPPFGEQGAKVDFCLRYETPLGTFWANNNNKNYVLYCQQRVKEPKEKLQKEIVKKKSCLKIASQNFSIVENISTTGASILENNKPDVPKEHADSMKEKQISDGQSGTSEEDSQKLLTKRRQICSRRSRRKAARMGRVKDYFAQRNGAVDTEREESPPEAEQTYHMEVQSLAEKRNKSEASQFVSESLETCSKPLLDVQQDTSTAPDYGSNSQAEKSESINLVESATLTGGASATDIPEDPLPQNDESTSSGWQNINRSVPKAEARGQREDVSCEMLAESADTFISEMNNESLSTQSNSFTFGTVVAPLYHQVFSRAGSESQSVGDQEIKTGAKLNIEDVTHAERKDTSCTFTTDACSNIDKAQGNAIQSLESSNQECVDALLKRDPLEEEEASLSVTEKNLQEPLEISQSDQRHTDAFEAVKEDVHLNPVNISNSDLLNPKILWESSDLQGGAQEDNLTLDLQSQTTKETTPDLTCTPSIANLEEALAQWETHEIKTNLEMSLISHQPSTLSKTEFIDDEAEQQASNNGRKEEDDFVKETNLSTTFVTSEEDELLQVLPDLVSYNTNNSTAKEAGDSHDSCLEIVASHEICVDTQEETKNVKERNKVACSSDKDDSNPSGDINALSALTESTMSHYRLHLDVYVKPKDEDTQEDAKINPHEMEPGAWKQDFYLADTYEAKNWEMMVEEEEKNILTGEEECEEISLQAGDIEAVEEDQVELLEDVWTDIVFVNRESTEEGRGEIFVMEITAADVVEEKQRIGGEEVGATGAGGYWAENEEEQTNKATEMEKTRREEELTVQAELQEDIPDAEMQRGNTEGTSNQIEGEIEAEEEVLLNDLEEEGLECEDEVPREGNGEEEGVRVDEANHEVAQSLKIEDRENEVGYLEGSLESDKNKVQDVFSAHMTNVKDNRATEIENREVHYAKIQTEIDENESAALELPKVTDENEFTADDPESDQASHDSSSESDLDDEVELYMHCLRAVHTGAKTQKDRSKDTGFSVGKRPSLNRGKLLSTPMPSISESLDEEQNISCLQDNHVDTDPADFEPTVEDQQVPYEQESIKKSVLWWKETFSCRNISRAFLYATLFLIFVVVAYHYDFLACFGLYLISLVWLWYQGERQPVKNKRIG